MIAHFCVDCPTILKHSPPYALLPQMEENHYSTNEELQATLQELADLQAQLAELQSDNDRLADEKDVLYKSLCHQTEKLEDSRTQIATLQELLLRDGTTADHLGATASEREQKLLDLLKNAQDERESLFVKQQELHAELSEMRGALDAAATEQARLCERISVLDSTLGASAAERKHTEALLGAASEESAGRQIEISRLTTLLENARAKIDELEQDRQLGDRSDLGELLDGARKEKDVLEGEVASLQECLSKSQCEVQRLKDRVACITEECKVARNNAKCAMADLEYKFEQLRQEKVKLSADYAQLQDTAGELQVQCKCHAEDKAQLEKLLQETQRHLGDTELVLADKEEMLSDEKRLRKLEVSWVACNDGYLLELILSIRFAERRMGTVPIRSADDGARCQRFQNRNASGLRESDHGQQGAARQDPLAGAGDR